MTDCVIGFDTSCYTTSAACVSLEGRVLGSCRKLLPVALGQRGLRQSEGVFNHVRQMPQVVKELFRTVGSVSIKAVGVSVAPRDGDDSYMPVFSVGDAHGRALAAALGVPCFASTHQRGHVRAARVDSGLPEGPFLALHLSGGTTELMVFEGEVLRLLGGTLDLHAGQLVDRIGVRLGLPFPAGPHLEALALKGEARALLPVAMAEGGLKCHFSGAEAQLTRGLAAGTLTPANAAREVYDLLGRTVARMLAAGKAATGLNCALVAGGVASSPLFRRVLEQRMAKLDRELQIYFGRPEYSGDNAVGPALLALEKLRKDETL